MAVFATPQGNRLGLNILMLPGMVHGHIKKGFHVALFYTTPTNTNEFDHNLTSYIKKIVPDELRCKNFEFIIMTNSSPPKEVNRKMLQLHKMPTNLLHRSML